MKCFTTLDMIRWRQQFPLGPLPKPLCSKFFEAMEEAVRENYAEAAFMEQDEQVRKAWSLATNSLPAMLSVIAVIALGWSVRRYAEREVVALAEDGRDSLVEESEEEEESFGSQSPFQGIGGARRKRLVGDASGSSIFEDTDIDSEAVDSVSEVGSEFSLSSDSDSDDDVFAPVVLLDEDWMAATIPEDGEEVVWSTTTDFGRENAIGGADRVPLPPLPKELDMGLELWLATQQQDWQSRKAHSSPQLEEVPTQDVPIVLEIADPVTEITDDDNGAAIICCGPTLPVVVPSGYCGGSMQSSKKVRAVSIVSVNGMTNDLSQCDEVDQAPLPSLTEVTITPPTLAAELPVRESAELDHPGQSSDEVDQAPLPSLNEVTITTINSTDGSPVRVSAGSDHPGRQEDRDEGSEPSVAALPEITTTNTTAESSVRESAGSDHPGRTVFMDMGDEELDHLVAALAKMSIACNLSSITTSANTTTTSVTEISPAIVQYSLGPGSNSAQPQSANDNVQPPVAQWSAGMEYEMEDSENGAFESQMEIDLPDLGSNAQWSQEEVDANWVIHDAAMGIDPPLPSTGLDLPDFEMEDAIANPVVEDVKQDLDSEMIEAPQIDSDLFWEEQRAIVNAVELPEVEDELQEEEQVTSVPEAQPSSLATIIAISQNATSPPAQVPLPAPVATAQLLASVTPVPSLEPAPAPAPAPSPAPAPTPAQSLAPPALAQQPAIAEQLPDIPSDDDVESEFDWDEYDAERAVKAMDATASAKEQDAVSEEEAQPAIFPAYFPALLRPGVPCASSFEPAKAIDEKQERAAELARRFAALGIPLDDDEEEEEDKPKAPLVSSPYKLRLREGDSDEEEVDLDRDPELWGSGDEEW